MIDNSRILFVLILMGLYITPAMADSLNKADAAVANILFDYDGSQEFASYAVNEDGFVDINFSSNMPNELYAELITKMQNHPDIDGVLAGKDGPICKLWK